MKARIGDPRRGAALFIVLLFAALLAGLAAVAFRASLSGARAAAAFLDVMRAEEFGRSAADILAYHVATGDAEARRAGALAVRLPEAEIDIDYRSESARIDVNSAPIPLIATLLTAAGAAPALVDAATQRITKLRAPPGGGAGAPAVAAGPAPQGGPAAAAPQPAVQAAPGEPPPAPNGPVPAANGQQPAANTAPVAPTIQDPSEVTRQWGLPQSLTARILDELTVAGSASVDPTLADRPVLAALLGGDPLRVDDYLAQRARGFGSTDAALDPLPVAARAYAGFTDVPTIRALVRVTIARRLVRRYEIVMEPPGGTGQSFAVRSWRPLF